MDLRRPTTLGLIVTLAVMCGCKRDSGDGGGKSLYDRLTEAREIADPLERAEALIGIGEEYAAAADALGARNSLKDAVEAADAVSLDTQAIDRAKIHVKLANAWHAANDSAACEDAYEEAEEALEKVDDAAEKSGILVDLAEVKIKIDEKGSAADDLKSAEQVSSDIVDLYERVEMLAWVTYRYVQMENKDEAKRVMDSANALAEAQGKPSEKARLLAVVGREQVSSLDDREAGLATLKQALEVARTIKDNPNLQANVLVDIAENYARVENTAQAREILNEAEELVRGLSEGKPVLQKIEQMRKNL